MGTMRISQLAERSGVPATTLRFYEKSGLLAADRTPSGYRMYDDDALDRLGFIGAAKRLGLPLDEISELLAVWEAGACGDVKADLRPRLAARLVEADQRAAELASFTATLHAASERLDALPDRTEKCDAECGLAPGVPGAPGGAPAVTTEPDRWRTEPVACSLTGHGQAERVAEWRSATAGAVRAAIPDGLRLTLPADRAPTLASLATAEQQCCPFFDFRLHLDGESVHLEARAPAEGREMLHELFAASADTR
ncbi:MerR family transcriptional regulator [Streptomyces sp. A7024]|uniref:MerR family transcriptional regulator n=1 Tax=Streptomyces coryli TaxID=1128680 RepID=A0A6G4UEZ0_9ACTN|nr:MerR family transcriptional regulator [Streptomyces coryli]NGN70368.1 MerR family transcriptional regulator [Streptomyces coryli]